MRNGRDLVRLRASAPAVAWAPRELRRLVAGRGELLAYLVVGLGVVASVLAADWGWFTPDARPELYQAPARALRVALSAWRSDPNLGQPNLDTGSAPMALVLLGIRALGASPWLTVRLWRALLIVAAGAGAVLLYHWVAVRDEATGPRHAAAGRVAAGLVYAANPYVVVAGATTPILLPYALLPWLLLALGRALREPRSWLWPAAFALGFFAAGGANAGVVPLFMLLALPCYLAWERLVRRVAARDLLVVAGRCLGLALLVSLYWIVPALAASGTGQTIAFNTERPRDVATASSYAETVRLLGLWTLYGRQGDWLFLPSFAAYLTSPLVVLGSFLLPIAAAAGALVSRARARALAVILLAVALPIMVGLFPTSGPSPFGRLLEQAFQRVPGAIAFRTTNKVGALAALGLTLLVAMGVAEAAAWLAGRRVRLALRGLAAVLAVLALVAGTLPAWTGESALLRFHVPAYWQQAAADLNAGRASARVLLVPGEVQADYRWGWHGPDDVGASLLSRRWAIRFTVPNGSDLQANFLAALDVPLASGMATGNMVSTMARYLGASDVLLRNDVAWERNGGPRPETVARALALDPDLKLVDSYGRPGENTIAPGIGGADLRPLQRYAVADPQPIVRGEPATGSLLVDGDGFALPSLHQSGLLRGQPVLRLLGSTTPEQLALALGDGARIVLTDSNRRRVWELHRTDQSWTATLPADTPIDPAISPSLSLFGDPAAQTVSTLTGARSISATSYGTVFGLVPYGKPEFAFDGDPRTAWLTGGFGTAVGQSINLQLDRRVEVSHLVLRPLLGGPVQIAKVRIRVDGGSLEVPVPPEPVVDVPIPKSLTGSLQITITGTRGGPGLNPVGFWEIGVPGVKVTQVARLPQRLRQLVAGLDAPARERLSATPLEVVLARQAGDRARPDDDEERALERSFWLPDERSFQASGLAAAATDLPEPAVDRLAGLPAGIVARSSSRAFDLLSLRASAAIDGEPDTAWVPARGVDDWIELLFPRQRMDHVTVTQAVPRGLKGVDVVTEARLSVDDGPPITAHLREGSVRIDLPHPVNARKLRLTLVKATGLGTQVRISEIGVGNVHVTPPAGSTALRGCVELARVDGRPLLATLQGTLQQLEQSASLPFAPCRGQRLGLGPGEHRLSSSAGWLVDLVHLDEGGAVAGGATRRAAATPRFTITSSTPTRLTLQSDPSQGDAWYLVLGQGFDSRWRATMDGQPLGPPTAVDGWSAGWRISDPRAHHIAVEFAPQRPATLSLVASLAALLVIAGLVVGALWRRRPGARPAGEGGAEAGRPVQW